MNLPWTLPPIHRPFFISTVLLVVVMILLGFTPIQLPPGSDKVLHLLMFALLSISIFCMWKKPIKWKTIVSAACMLCLSVGSELVQGLVSHRSFDWFDILSNLLGSSLGITVAFGLSFLYDKYKSKRVPDLEEGAWNALIDDDFNEIIPMDHQAGVR